MTYVHTHKQVAAPQLRTVGGKIVIDTASLLISNAPDRSHELADVVLDQVSFSICMSVCIFMKLNPEP
jgi:hypothetical protein